MTCCGYLLETRRLVCWEFWAEKLPEDADCRTCWNWGNIVEYDCRTVLDADFYVQDKEADWHEVEAVNGSLIATQYDIPWREDILSGWEFYDVA